MKRRSKIIWRITIILLICAALVIACLFGISDYKEKKHQEKLEEVRMMIQSEEVQGLFCAMFPLSTYNANDFEFYRGINTVLLDEPLRSGEELVSYLQSVLQQYQYLQTIYIGLTKPLEELDAEKILENRKEGIVAWEYTLKALITQYSELNFELILEYPSAQELSELSESEKEYLYNWYGLLAELFEKEEHITIYMPGTEQWLISNPANYLKNGEPNKEVAKHVLIQMICDGLHVLTEDNYEEKITKIKEAEKNLVKDSKEKSDYTYVFFGDSVIGNYTDSMSVPGVVQGLTGARVINCGYGGLSAAKTGNELGFPDIIDAFLEGTYEQFTEYVAIRNGIQDFYDKLPEMDQEKLVFFINFGLNDYMSKRDLRSERSQDVSTYKGALEYGMEKLQEAYPNSEIVLLTPNFLARYHNGTEILNGYDMEELAATVLLIGKEHNTKYIDIFHELGITSKNHETYLADLCHPNEYGRYEIGTLVYKYIKKWNLQ